MAELRITGIDEQALERWRAEARAEGVSLEAKVRALIEGEAQGDRGISEDKPQTLRMPPEGRSFRDIQPVDAPGISASELLLRDRRRGL